MKKILLILLLFIGCNKMIVDKPYKNKHHIRIYQNIHMESYFKNLYTLYSGITYHKNKVDRFGNIEYQISYYLKQLKANEYN